MAEVDPSHRTVSSAHPDGSRGIVVLLIDDQPIVGHAVKEMLRGESDIEFHFCKEPLNAVALAAELGPTVILQDLVMPDVDGLTLLKFFRANAATRDIPMIVLSSKEEPAIKAQAFALGANDYLVKLPDRVELVARIRHHSRGYIAQIERNEAYRKLAASERQLANEVRQAAVYVQSLLPAPLKEPPVTIEWKFVPSTQLGGDAFGYHWLDDQHFAIYLLDVSGHGVGSSLLAVSVLNILTHKTLPETDFLDPSAVMEGLNKVFTIERHGGLFFTIWYGVYSPPTRSLVFSGGGHPPPLLFGGTTVAEAQIEELQSAGPPIGITNLLPFENTVTSIPAFGRLLLYSDGAVEVGPDGGDIAGQNEFNEFAKGAGPADNLIDLVIERAKKLSERDVLNDDCSLVRIDFV